MKNLFPIAVLLFVVGCASVQSDRTVASDGYSDLKLAADGQIHRGETGRGDNSNCSIQIVQSQDAQTILIRMNDSVRGQTELKVGPENYKVRTETLDRSGRIIIGRDSEHERFRLHFVDKDSKTFLFQVAAYPSGHDFQCLLDN